jgi:hypothetical protein
MNVQSNSTTVPRDCLQESPAKPQSTPQESAPANNPQSALATIYAIAERAYYRDLAERQARATALFTAEGLTVGPGTIGGRVVPRVIVRVKREECAA